MHYYVDTFRFETITANFDIGITQHSIVLAGTICFGLNLEGSQAASLVSHFNEDRDTLEGERHSTVGGKCVNLGELRLKLSLYIYHDKPSVATATSRSTGCMSVTAPAGSSRCVNQARVGGITIRGENNEAPSSTATCSAVVRGRLGARTSAHINSAGEIYRIAN
jgi:hypothetical protein